MGTLSESLFWRRGKEGGCIKINKSLLEKGQRKRAVLWLTAGVCIDKLLSFFPCPLEKV